MARGTQLSALVDQLRAEIGASTNVAMGVNSLPMLKQLLNRVQQQLWEAFDWPFAFIERDEQMVANQRYYTFDAEIDFGRITSAHVKYSSSWRPLEYGIGVEQYNSSDPSEGDMQDPPTRWRHYEGNQFEVWPMPSSNDCVVRFKAIKKCPLMSNDADVALLDDNLIVMYAAAELLARAKSDDAQAKSTVAERLFQKLKGQGIKTDVFTLGGGGDNADVWSLKGARITPSTKV